MSLWIEEDRLPRGGKTGLSTEKKYLIGQGGYGGQDSSGSLTERRAVSSCWEGTFPSCTGLPPPWEGPHFLERC